MTKAGVHGPTGDCGDEADGGVHGRTVVAALRKKFSKSCQDLP